MKPKEVLKKVREAAIEGQIKLAPNEMAAALDSEIQEIFQGLCDALGKKNKRGIFATDQSRISDVTDDIVIIKKAEEILGIEFSSKDTFVDVGLKLRGKRKAEQ